ncbi:MAG: hypothetical protein ACE5EV_06120, partial [Gaiellales bacterium]
MEFSPADREEQDEGGPPPEAAFPRPPGDPSGDLVDPAASAPAWAQVDASPDLADPLDVSVADDEHGPSRISPPVPSDLDVAAAGSTGWNDELPAQGHGPAGDSTDADRRDAAMLDVPLGTLVYRSGLLDAEQIEAALEESERLGKRLGEVLVDSGMILERDLGRLLAGQRGLPFIDVSAIEIEPGAAELLPAASARIYCAVPVRLEDGVPLVAVSDPSNGLVVEGVKRALGVDLNLAVAARGELQAAISAVYGLDAEDAEQHDAGLLPPAAGAENDPVTLELPSTDPAPVATPEPDSGATEPLGAADLEPPAAESLRGGLRAPDASIVPMPTAESPAGPAHGVAAVRVV